MTVIRKPQDIKVYPMTNRALAESKMNLVAEKHINFRIAYYAVRRARQTGRIHGGAEMYIRQMNGYAFCKLVITIMNSTMDADEAARWINLLIDPAWSPKS